MYRISLTSGPRAPRPDYILRGRFFGDFGGGLVGTERIDILPVPTGQARSVLARQRRLFAEVDLDRTDAELQQISDLILVPLHSVRIAEIERGIVRWKLAAIVLDVITLLDNFFPQLVLAREVRVLPQA